jgi:hypothetical protein
MPRNDTEFTKTTMSPPIKLSSIYFAKPLEFVPVMADRTRQLNNIREK